MECHSTELCRIKSGGDKMALTWSLHLCPLLSWEVGDATLIHWVSQPMSTLSLSCFLQLNFTIYYMWFSAPFIHLCIFMLRQLMENCGIFRDIREILYFNFYFTGWFGDARDVTRPSCKCCTHEFFLDCLSSLELYPWVLSLDRHSSLEPGLCAAVYKLHAHSLFLGVLRRSPVSTHKPRETEAIDPIKLRTLSLVLLRR